MGGGEVAPGQLFAALLQRPQIDGYIQHRQQFCEFQCQKRRGEGAVVVLYEEDGFNKHQYQPRQSCLPDQRQAFGDAPQPQKQRTDNAPEEPGYPRDQRAPQDGARLALGGKGAQEQQHQRHQRRAEENASPPVIERFPTNEKRTQQYDQPYIRGDLAQPRQMDALMPRPMAGRGHEEAEEEQCQRREQHGQNHRQGCMLHQPHVQQIGIRGHLLGAQQIGGNGDHGRIAGVQRVGERLLRGVQRLVAVCQLKIFKGTDDLPISSDGDGQVTVGGIAGELLRKNAGQVADHLSPLLLGDISIFNGTVVIGTVTDQHARIGQRAAQEAVGDVDGSDAVSLVHRLAQEVAAVQKHVVADKDTHTHAAQNGQNAEHQRQHEGGGLRPRLV